jgi:hypothetical protein
MWSQCLLNGLLAFSIIFYYMLLKFILSAIVSKIGPFEGHIDSVTVKQSTEIKNVCAENRNFFIENATSIFHRCVFLRESVFAKFLYSCMPPISTIILNSPIYRILDFVMTSSLDQSNTKGK